MAPERDRLPRFLSIELSPRQIDMREVLAVAELRGTLPDHIVAIGLQPERVEMSTELSAVLSGNMEALLESVAQRLGVWGHTGRRTD